MKKTLLLHKQHWSKKEYRRSLYFGIFLFTVSMFFNHFASIYANMRASNHVTDILLDNIRVYDVDGILIWGAVLYSAYVILYALKHPHKIPFFLKSLAIFFIIRSFFISMTHLGPSPIELYINPADLFSRIIIGKDLFFSGHTGAPFLLALVFWKDKLVRNISLAASIIFGVCVILGHLHYTIDVFSAFFITYSIYKIVEYFFPKDLQLFDQGGL